MSASSTNETDAQGRLLREGTKGSSQSSGPSSYREEILILFVCLLVLAFDLIVPLGVAGGIPFVIPVWLANHARRRWTLRATVFGAIGFIILGWAGSNDSAGFDQAVILTNRVMAILAVLAAAGPDFWLTHRERSPLLRIPGFVFLTPLLTLLIMSGVIWTTYSELSRVASTSDRDQEVLLLESRVLYYDEVLTMSAQMYAATGERTWSERYSEADSQLARALDDLRAIANPEEQAQILQTRVANQRLVDAEGESILLADQGRLDEASAVFGSQAYIDAKEAYLGGMLALRETMAQGKAAREGERETNVIRAYSVLGIALILCFTVWVGMIRDLEQWRRAEARVRMDLTASNDALHEKNLDLQQFAYVASHDLQTPLRHISGFVQLLQSEYGRSLDERATGWIEHVVVGVGRMESMIRDLVDFSRVEAREARWDRVDLAEAAKDAIASLGASVEEAGAAIEIGELPTIMADRSQVVLLLSNLIGNGLKYSTESESRIDLSASRSTPSEWIISVADNGIGIDPQYHERVFEIFKRLHASGEYPGTGMGLAICRRIVARHGGRIWIESEPGKGTTVLFGLPRSGSSQDGAMGRDESKTLAARESIAIDS